jgi:hypothetical protein
MVGQECLAKTWLYEANGGCAGEELKAIKYFYWVGLLRPLEAGQETHPLEKPNSKKCRPMLFYHPWEKFTIIVFFT